MKVCPVCQYEEGDDAELACAICGSDLEFSEPDTSENVSDPPASELPSVDEKIEESKEEEIKTEELTDEEKEIEEALAGAEVPADSSSSNKFDFNKYLSFIGDFGKVTEKFTSTFDKFFKKDNKLTYVGPLVALFIAILIFFSVLGVTAMTVPRGLDVNSDGEPIYAQNGPPYNPEATPTSDPFSGEPFNCEMWDKQRYIEYKEEEKKSIFNEELGESFTTTRDYYITDTNRSGYIDDEERYGCPVNITFGSGFALFALNGLFLIVAFYLYYSIPNTSLTLPLIIFAFSQILLFVVYGGLLDQLIFAIPLTLGFAATVCLIVASSVLFARISLDRPLDEPVTLNFYFFVIVIALLLSSVFLNYAQGPYAVCENPYGNKPIPFEPLNDYGFDGIVGTNDEGENNGIRDVWDDFDDFGLDGVEALDIDGDGNYTSEGEIAPDEDGSEGNGRLDWTDLPDENGTLNGIWDQGEGEEWEDGNGDSKYNKPESFTDTDGDGKYDDNYVSELDMFLIDLANKEEDDRGTCQLLDTPHKDINVTFVDFSAGQDSTIMLLAATFLFIGIGNWLISSTRINDLDEAKYMTMIISGLVLQYLIFAYNMLTTEGSGFGLDQNDLTLTVMALGISSVGLYSFYNKRRGEQGSIGVAYFVIFAAGILSLFATFILPIALGGVEMDEMDGDANFNLLLSALVTAVGFWLVYKFGSQKLREMSLATDRAMPNREDPFAPTVDGQQKAMPEWSVDSAMEFLMQEYGEEFQIELKHTTEHTPDQQLVEKTMMDDVDHSVKIRPAIQVDYDVDFNEIAEAYSTTPETVDEVITHLTSGKNIMLFGEPGTGKTALSNILLTKLCGEIEQPNGSKAPNYTIVTANAEWSNFEVIGGISPDDSGGYYFKDGYVAEAAKLCEKSIVERGKPHYLVIDEFNRANIDEAFGKLFTVFEYRDKQPLLTHKETGGAPFMMPPEFRIIGTMNTQDKNTLFNVGFALMRRFAFVEIGLPIPEDEYNRMPVFVYFKLKKLGLVPERPEGDDLWKFGDKCRHFPSRKFDFYDDDGNMYKCHEKLVKFLAPGEPPKRGEETALGVRTFRKIGPALVIDSMVTMFNSIKKYGPELALDRVIRSNIMPSLEGLERNEIRCMFLQAKEVLGPDSLVTETLDRMANSDSLSLF
ncbi:MAG: AAA family ATPase [Candidatus Thermoplasmatota archaeon]|nr:AAA family ATPase [Candidatus Thermoplasmatota archaeon]